MMPEKDHQTVVDVRGNDPDAGSTHCSRLPPLASRSSPYAAS